ncbi:Lacal_2735 family protein [Carboxylicivirga taeanensis]|uniref:Lacal_2735 family protein n=1 Tax=Carboxylicivirga taeanensis TaxID=1416875 RepID=UPI003F6DB733
MFNFLKANKEKKLQKKYNKLLEEAFHLSKVNRKLSDEKYVEAEKLLASMESKKP